MFPYKNMVIYNVFSALASKNFSDHRYLRVFFFTFRPFLLYRKPTQVTQISCQYTLELRHPKIVEKSRKHHQDLDSVRNLESPPPAKADIATAILTNVIEHFVLLMPPNKHAFTAKAVWADFLRSCMPYAHGSSSPEP